MPHLSQTQAGGFEVVGKLYEDPDAYCELLASERLRMLVGGACAVVGKDCTETWCAAAGTNS